MKKVIIVLSLITSSLASAKTVTKMPEINFSFKKVPVSDVCLENESIRTKNAVTYCSDYATEWVSTGPRRSEGYFNTICVAEASAILSRPVTYQSKKCVRWEGRRSENVCAEYAEVANKIPTDYTYGVYNVHILRGERIERLIETRKISISDCQ